jgi:phosphopantothenoylcysteine synthetase/decarboxylase
MDDMADTLKNTARAPILLIITGSIAAYKALELIRRLKDKGHDVRVVIVSHIDSMVETSTNPKPLSGRHVLVTAGW